MDHFFTIEKQSVAEFKDRGSRFLAHAFPVISADDFKKQIQQLKKEHAKAVHHCFAYRIGTEGNIYRSSDDGEPSGSAGKPILGQIDSKNLTDVAVVVVRYFGGTLLGVPGLINAYKTSTALVLQTVPIIQKPILIHYQLDFDYTLLNDMMNILRQTHGEILKREINLFCTLDIGIPRQKEEEFLFRIKDHHQLNHRKKNNV